MKVSIRENKNFPIAIKFNDRYEYFTVKATEEMIYCLQNVLEIYKATNQEADE